MLPKILKYTTSSCQTSESDACFYRSTAETTGPCMGGVLADVMGLGKTLTTLSLVFHLKAEAAKYRSCQHELPADCATLLSKSTLVVVPSFRK